MARGVRLPAPRHGSAAGDLPTLEGCGEGARKGLTASCRGSEPCGSTPWEEKMSLLTRKNGSGAAEAGRRARQQASRAVPVAKNAGVAVRQRADDAAAKAMPLAKNAGAAVRQRADDAAAWAGPHVQDARAWAAPHVEQAGIAVQEKLAPQVSDMLTKAARQLDPAPKSRRRSPLAVAAALLAAAASAAAVVALLRRRARP